MMRAKMSILYVKLTFKVFLIACDGGFVPQLLKIKKQEIYL